MKKFFLRLLPALGLLCLPLFGGYSPVTTRESLHLNDAQLVAIDKKMAFQGGTVTREYFITLVADAPREGIRDWGPLLDYRFFSTLTNFRHNSLTNQGVIARTPLGQNFINTIGPFPQYGASNTYPGYGRFWFNAGQTRVHDFYGRNNGTPWTDQQYLDWVNRDMLVRATGSPYEWLKANPSGW